MICFDVPSICVAGGLPACQSQKSDFQDAYQAYCAICLILHCHINHQHQRLHHIGVYRPDKHLCCHLHELTGLAGHRRVIRHLPSLHYQDRHPSQCHHHCPSRLGHLDLWIGYLGCRYHPRLVCFGLHLLAHHLVTQGLTHHHLHYRYHHYLNQMTRPYLFPAHR